MDQQGRAKRPESLRLDHWVTLTEDSAIDPAIVIERGYKTITRKEALDLGFKGAQARPGWP